jgi:hypothetical protein
MLETRTYLSPYVSELLSLAHSPGAVPSSALIPSYLDNCSLWDFDQIFARLPSCTDKSAEWYQKAVVALAPVFAQAGALAVSAAVVADWETDDLLAWASCDRQQLEQLLTQLSEPVGVLETVLAVCPLLEQGLGSILAAASPGEPVPPLLRDILASPELAHVLGAPAVTFLQVRNSWYSYTEASGASHDNT